MDLTNADEARLTLGVARFLEGHTIVCHQVVFRKIGQRCLEIRSFSGWAPEATTLGHAKERIERAKTIMASLADRSEPFRRVVSSLPHEHHFCYDFGGGSITLAREAGSTFEWVHHRAKG